jgi:uncharacterized membrane protein YqjE
MSASTRPTEEQSLGQLVSRVTTNVSSLVRLEIELAKAELQEQLRQGAAGGGMALVAAALAGLALMLASFAAVYGLAQVMPVWAAFLVVAGVYLLLAALLGYLAARRFRKLRGPERAIAEANRTVEVLTEHNGARAQARASGLTTDELAVLRDEADPGRPTT